MGGNAMKTKMLKIPVFILAVVLLALSITACSASGKTFTVESIQTKNVGFAGMTSSGLSSQDIVLVGKIGSKTYEIRLNGAFENYTVNSFSGQYKETSVLAFDPDIASLSLKLKDAEGNITDLSVAPGDKFAAEVRDGKAVLFLPEE